MTNHEPPTQPYQPYQQSPWPPAAPQRKRRRWPWIVGGAVALVLLVCGIGAAVTLNDAANELASTPAPGTARKPSLLATPTTQPAQPAVAANKPAPKDFKITVKILSKQCFGSAGCNITYRIDPTYSGAQLDPGKTYLVTYEVAGVEDGPAVNTFELTGDQASFEAEEFAQTKSKSTKVTAKATDVIEQG